MHILEVAIFLVPIIGTGCLLNRRAATSKGALDSRCVLIAALSWVCVTVLTPNGAWTRLAAEGVLAVAALILVRAPIRWLLLRFLVLLPFFILAALPLALRKAPTASGSGASFALLLVLRASICFGALAAAFRGTGATGLLDALARLRVPPILLTTTTLMLRYLETLEDEALRMIRARDARGVPLTVRARAGVAGAMVGSMFVRSFERSERVSNAMRARGFTGLLPPPRPAALARVDWVALACFLALQVGILNLR